MISTLLTVGSFVVGASGAFVAVYTLRSTKRQTDATTGKITSESGKIQAETAFVGSQYIRDLSEASVALALPFRAEIDTLRKILAEKEKEAYEQNKEISELQRINLDLRVALNDERTERHEIKEIYEARLNALFTARSEDGTEKEATPGSG